MFHLGTKGSTSTEVWDRIETSDSGKEHVIGTQHLPSKKILLVEDNPDNRILLLRILKSTYPDINMAQDGQEGVEMALKIQPDLILMDLQMPRMGGQEATQILREKGYTGVVVALTAHALKEEKDRCLKNGFNAYVTKPVDRKVLFETLSSFLPG